ncbi:carboxylate-amine ligase [Diaminobutyricimonas aerilata]|uniref:Putative glutamate--cysteine ligase 2 n=1 Tax=Diaminobutyricimonas aerilata TaxID=1162967 RepID=A0A2M9CIR9_9MICO|nr:glutamate--cysteine ligase [Diaminobutyricimonas aerilata]PJJ71755.1 carboxylate-amine ligase [Diaminobutyricimonas aerilata]
MRLEFAASERSTIGIEWELACVDRGTRALAPAGPAILDRIAGDPGTYPQATSEFLTNTVEIVSGAHHRVGDAMGDLHELLAAARAAADPLGVDLISAGTHPFARMQDQQVTPGSERYRILADRMRWWADHLLIWGLHVHVGVEDAERAVHITNGLIRYFPHLQALSASSPFFIGEDTGYASNRAMIFQQASTAGLPPHLGAWANFEQYVEDVTKVGIIAEPSELRWDVRPSPKWGTVEVRICDAPSSAREVAALAALIQCTVERLGEKLDAGEEPVVLPPWFSRENKWRAARYGLDCEAIVDPDGTERPLVDDVLALVDEVEPIARRLGCDAELRDIEAILDAGSGYQRQLSTAARHDGELVPVVDALVAELRDGAF